MKLKKSCIVFIFAFFLLTFFHLPEHARQRDYSIVLHGVLWAFVAEEDGAKDKKGV